MTSEPVAVKPRLLGVEEVRQACAGIGRDLALQVIHAAGAVHLGRRLFVRPEDLDAHLAQLREDGVPSPR